MKVQSGAGNLDKHRCAVGCVCLGVFGRVLCMVLRLVEGVGRCRRSEVFLETRAFRWSDVCWVETSARSLWGTCSRCRVSRCVRSRPGPSATSSAPCWSPLSAPIRGGGSARVGTSGYPVLKASSSRRTETSPSGRTALRLVTLEVPL